MSIDDTIRSVLEASSWAQRIQQIRLVPQKHGTGEHTKIFAKIARELYVRNLSPDFAYIHAAQFYDCGHFSAAYEAAHRLTCGFTSVDADTLACVIEECPTALLIFRTLLGLTKEEFAHSTVLVAAPMGVEPVSASVIDRLERLPLDDATKRTIAAETSLQISDRAKLLAHSINALMEGSLFGPAPDGLRLKQKKPDTEHGWETVREFATNKVPLWVLLHQRHYGGAYRQILDATSSLRGNLIEDAVESLFSDAGISFVRTGSHNQAEVAARFEVSVAPAPDFVVYDPTDDGLRALLECKGTNNGGTARDKAPRFSRLREESIRLGGIPLFAVLGGIGWARINDALAPVIRDTDGRVFTISTLHTMLEVAPFTSLIKNTPPE